MFGAIVARVTDSADLHRDNSGQLRGRRSAEKVTLVATTTRPRGAMTDRARTWHGVAREERRQQMAARQGVDRR